MGRPRRDPRHQAGVDPRLDERLDHARSVNRTHAAALEEQRDIRGRGLQDALSTEARFDFRHARQITCSADATA